MLTLGNQPIELRAFRPNPDNGAVDHVFAACDRPTIVYGQKGQIHYSNVNLRDVSAMNLFNCQSYPGSMVFFSEGREIIIGSIDRVQKLHIKTIRTRDCPRRICHQPEKECFGVLSVTTKKHLLSASNIMEEDTSFLKVYEHQSMECRSRLSKILCYV